ncbi:hypothetical protein [Spirosoma gilvum]
MFFRWQRFDQSVFGKAAYTDKRGIGLLAQTKWLPARRTDGVTR